MTAILFLLAAAQTLYADHGNPTADEQHVLEVINRARANPFAEGTRLGIDITENAPDPPLSPVGARPPLAMNVNLLAAARAHSQDMYTRNYFSHTTLGGPTFDQRILNAGYNWNVAGGQVGENIVRGLDVAAPGLEDALMIDAGYPDRGHRRNLIDVTGLPNYFREIGVGYYHNNTPNLNNRTDFLTQDFGLRNFGPFLVGVVRNDSNNNDFYDLGEGMAGVTITVTGNGYYAVSGTAGGFAIPLTVTGSVTVTASGGGMLGPVSKVVTLGTNNVKLDFELQDVPDVEPDGMPDAWETANGLTVGVNDAAGDADSDGFTNLEEFQGGSNPQSATSVPPGDKDADGMPNQWEAANGLNPVSNDAGLDPDADGFTNLEEYTGGGNPQSNTSVPAGDKDGDGMPNPWEAANGLNPLVNDAALDPDGDSFTNLEEYQGGGNPQDIASIPAGDKDGDGMPNPWEVQYQLNPLVDDAYGDADGDTVANLVEYLNGTNPRDPNSFPEEEEDDCGALGLEFLAPWLLIALARKLRR